MITFKSKKTKLSEITSKLPKYPDQFTPKEALVDWGATYGVSFDSSGLAINSGSLSQKEQQKISPYFQTTVSKIDSARSQGKHVILLPGGYDLAHVGHLSWAVQAEDYYLSKVNKDRDDNFLTREDLYVAMLVDDDDMVSEIKKDAYLKVIGQRGPIEKGSLSIEHPRLSSLAKFPVDLVGFVPSPVSVDELPKPAYINAQSALESFKQSKLWVNQPEHAQRVQRAIAGYPSLASRIEIGERIGFDSDLWSVELWNLYLLSSLNSKEIGGKSYGAPVTRVLSTEEKGYFDIVKELMSICKINVLEMNDVYWKSTRQIVESMGVDVCLEIKNSQQTPKFR